MPVTGQITDRDDDPVEGASVFVIDQADDSIMGTASTDANGDYSIETTADTTVHVFATWTDGDGVEHSVFSKGWIDVAEDDPTVVLEDYERSNPLDDYVGNTENFGVNTSDPIEGQQSLESTSAYGFIARDDENGQMERGYSYSFTLRYVSGENMFIYYGSQDPFNPDEDCYRLWMADGDFLLSMFDGSQNNLDRAYPTITDQTYTVEIDYPPLGESHEVRLFDESGTELASIGAVDDTWEGGYWAWYGGSGAGFVYDTITEAPL